MTTANDSVLVEETPVGNACATHMSSGLNKHLPVVCDDYGHILGTAAVQPHDPGASRQRE
jgi:hypothetical protein